MHFTFSATPQMYFAAGSIQQLPDLVRTYGSRTLLVTGKRAFEASQACANAVNSMQQHGEVRRFIVCGEPSPNMIDDAVSKFQSWKPNCVVGIGGGSVIDAAKAISGLLDGQGSIMDYLEGVGADNHIRAQKLHGLPSQPPPEQAVKPAKMPSFQPSGAMDSKNHSVTTP